jgi:PAS domain S-box-containing protein
VEVTLEELGIGRLFQDVRDAIIVAEAGTEQIVAWNACASAIFGYSEEEAKGLPLYELVPHNLRSAHRTGIARYHETGGGNLINSGTAVELVGLHKDGSEVPIELTLTAIPETDADGHRFALAIVRDVAERRAAEETALKLRDAQARQQQALELNDTIVQGLAVAKMALESGHSEKGLEAVTETLKRVKELVAGLLADLAEGGWEDGSLVRDSAARVTEEPPN